MLEMLEVYKIIRNELLKVCPDVYTVDTRGGTYPRIYFEIPNTYTDSIKRDSVLEITLWDKSKNIEGIENMCNSIELLLDGFRYMSDDLALKIDFEGAFNIRDDVEGVQRKLLRFKLRIFK